MLPSGSASTRSATRVTSFHSGSHWFSWFHTYGRWNSGTWSSCGERKTSWGVRTRVCIGQLSEKPESLSNSSVTA